MPKLAKFAKIKPYYAKKEQKVYDSDPHDYPAALGVAWRYP